MAQNRAPPRGIITLAIAEFLLGISALIDGIVHLTLGVGGLADFSGKNLTLTSSTASALQNAFTLEGVLLLVSGYGVWSMRNWGFGLTVAIALLGLATSLAALALQSSFSIVGIIGNIAILVYASRPPVRAHFTSTTATTA